MSTTTKWDCVWQMRLFMAVTSIKMLLMPGYHSTDFEVHRNWMAITHSLPMSQWYTEATSPWTLDYPPLFAWFEAGLAYSAKLADPAMLEIQNLDYASSATVWFQRCSVMASDVVLAAAVAYAVVGRAALEQRAAFAAAVASGGLLMVDHIHFQYNGMLLGLLIAAVALAERGRPLLSAAVFAILVNMKHLYAAAGPAFAVYLLRSYCRGPRRGIHFAQLALVVALVCSLSLGPFVLMGQLSTDNHRKRFKGMLSSTSSCLDMLSSSCNILFLARLFPIGRGLCHAYWAPNAWALYATADRVIAAVAARLDLLSLPSSPAGMTAGLVGGVDFVVLPSVEPAVAAALTLTAQVPALVALWRHPGQVGALWDAVVLSFMCSFVWGYHVHEKAILMVLLPMAVNAARNQSAASSFLFLAAVGHHSLFPLLHQPREWPIKVVIAATYLLLVCQLLSLACSQSTTQPEDLRNTIDDTGSIHDLSTDARTAMSSIDSRRLTKDAKQNETAKTTVVGANISRAGFRKLDYAKAFEDDVGTSMAPLEQAYLWALVPLEMYCTFGHTLLFRGKGVDNTTWLPFLPLLLTSAYCSLGVCWAWGRMEVEALADILSPKVKFA